MEDNSVCIDSVPEESSDQAMDGSTPAQPFVAFPTSAPHRPVRPRLVRPIRTAIPATSIAGPGSGTSSSAKRQYEFSTIPQIGGRKRKRQKIKDQMKGSIDCPPLICNGIYGIDTVTVEEDNESDVTGMSVRINGFDNLGGLMMMDRGLTYYCPSKSTAGKHHKIGLKIENGKTKFSCSCDHMGGKFDSSKNSCSHIRATVIKIMLDMISTHQSALDVNNITDLMNAMMV